MPSTQGEQGAEDDIGVVITEVCSVGPFGLDVETNWQNILAAKSGVGRVERFDVF